MQKTLLIAYSFINLLSLLIYFWFIPKFTPPGSGYGLAPNVLPNILAIIMFISSFILIVKTALLMRAGSPDTKSSLTFSNVKHLTLYGIVLFSTFPLMTYIGFIAASLIVLTVLQILCGQRKPVTITLVSLCTTAVFYCLIVYVVNAPLP